MSASMEFIVLMDSRRWLIVCCSITLLILDWFYNFMVQS